jgi:beta-mannosidase
VPGAVQLDWARAKGLPDYRFGSNVRAYDGLEDYHWLYRTRIPDLGLRPGEEAVFACGGVDYACEVRIGGKAVLRHEGMFSPFETEVGARAGEALEVLVLPAPKEPGEPPGRSQARRSCKPAVSYGWDWHPRLIPLGIWAESGFVVRPRGRLRSAEFSYELAEDLSSALVTVASDPPGAAWRLLDGAGRAVLEGSSEPRVMGSPRLWWCHDQGEPHLYTLEATLGGDVLRRRVGIRRTRLVVHEGGWAVGGFPASRAKPPITVEINGRRIFARGSNWVSADVFPGRVDAGVVRPLVTLARDANFNLLRSWGGAIVNPEAFFDACDEMGMLVWQEFPLACNDYPDDPAYLAVLDRESRSIISRVRRHPCLAIWGGGNELFNAWSGMTDQSLALRLLNRNCLDLDPRTPFLPTAPLDGMGHGDYRFRDDRGREVFEIFGTASNTAYSEFGCPGPAPEEALRTFIPEAELWPPRPGTSWETHHAFGAWEADPSSHLYLPMIERYFGKSQGLGELVARGQWLQATGLLAVFEEARRQKPRCSMALNWCFNEAWPTAAGNALVGWPAKPGPAYASAKAACRPVLASARIPRFQWRPGEAFEAQLWVLNDSCDDLPPGQVRACLVAAGERVPLGSWDFPGGKAGRNVAGPALSARVPQAAPGELRLEVEAGPANAWGSAYRLSLAAP